MTKRRALDGFGWAILGLLACLLGALAERAHADAGLDGAVIVTRGLGFERFGVGSEIDADGYWSPRWGWDLTALGAWQGKGGATGPRWIATGMVRRFSGPWFGEVGIHGDGYRSTFPDGTVWEKHGWSPAVGVGQMAGIEWSLRYVFPDSTINESDVLSISVDIPIDSTWQFGVVTSFQRFDQGGERRQGTTVVFQLGRRW